MILTVLQLITTAHSAPFNRLEAGVQPPTPPGTILIDSNYYLDKNEITVVAYKEHQFWTARVYGEDSEEFRKALPSEEVLTGQSKVPHDYFSNPKYLHHPMIGISWEQAAAYTTWRTDRVCQMRLIQAGHIGIHLEVGPETHFTYRRYLNGQYLDYEPVEEIELEVYGLPTSEEWDNKIIPLIEERGVRKGKKGRLRATTPPEGTVVSLTNSVSEMTATRGLARGGNWKAGEGYEEAYRYSGPTDWLGFRNKCEITTIKRTR